MDIILKKRQDNAKIRAEGKEQQRRLDETMEMPGVWHNEDQYSTVLAELCQLSQEHREAASETKTTPTRLENDLEDLVKRTAGLEQKTTLLEERVSEAKNRAIAFLFLKEAKLSAKCEDLWNPDHGETTFALMGFPRLLITKAQSDL